MPENPEQPKANTTSSTQPEQQAAQGVLRRWWRESQRRWWSRWLIQLAIVLIVVMIVSAFQARHLISRGEAAPNFVLRDLQGVEHELAQYRGKTVLLAFMAPWCTVCGLEASNLVAVSDDDPDKVVLGLMIDYSSPAEAQAFVEEHEITFPVLLGNESVHRAYAVKSFPTLYVIDEEGAIRHAVVGYTTWAGLKLRLAL